MAEISSSTWSETDASNNAASPDGAPEGMLPSGVNDTIRQAMGSLKRAWNRLNGTVTTTGSAGAYAYATTNASFPAAYVQGEVYRFTANFESFGADTLAVNALPALPLYKRTGGGRVAIGRGDIQANDIIEAVYDVSLNGASGGFQISSPAVTLRSYLAGLTLSAAGGSGTFGIAAGVASDTTNASLMALASAYTKTTASWVVGSGNGGLDTGAIANGTWYHVWLIQRVDTGVVDPLFSLSATNPTLPANYTLGRRIGPLKTDGSAHWIAFSQLGDEFLWSVALGDVAVANLSTSPTLFALTVPTGVKVNALFRAYGNATGGANILLNSPDESAVAVASPAGNVNLFGAQVSGGVVAGGQFNLRTDTSGRIQAVSSGAGTSLDIATYGWVDRRGRDL